MLIFRRAIVRKPGKSLVDGITTANLGIPDYRQALIQHENYIQALEDCGLQVSVLQAKEEYPDSTFIEDVALLTPQCAILLNPGAPTRRGEITGMDRVLGEFYQNVYSIEPPGTVEGGDILQIGDHYYVGLSERTNPQGANQVVKILEENGLMGTTVRVESMLHLKTGIANLNGKLITSNPGLLKSNTFRGFPVLQVDPDEAYAANCLYINGTVLLPAGFPKTTKMLREAGYPVRTVEVSEFRKLDGGLSCLSLRF